MTNRVLRTHHVGIVVQDLEASIAWYGRHLGFERITEYAIPGARVTFVKSGAMQLEFFQTEGAAPMSADRAQAATNLKLGGINHLAIAVDDLDTAVVELRDAGVEIASPPREVPDGHGDRFAFIRDNERMLIELYQPGERAKP